MKNLFVTVLTAALLNNCVANSEPAQDAGLALSVAPEAESQWIEDDKKRSVKVPLHDTLGLCPGACSVLERTS